MIVLDTNILSEGARPKPNPEYSRWAARIRQRETFTTTVTIAELRYGVAALEQGRKRAALHTLIEEGIVEAYRDRILPFDLAASADFASIAAARKNMGRPISTADCMIAAICRAHGAVLATDNTKDFVETGVTQINPLQA